MIGQKFGRYTILKKDPDYVGKYKKVICQCDCGTIKSVYLQSLTSSRTISCGCYWFEQHKQRNTKDPLEVCLNHVYKSHKLGCKIRGRGLKPLPLEIFKTLSQQPCHYCGSFDEIRPYLSTRGTVTDSTTSLERAKECKASLCGIDRVDNSRGYEENNVVPCCFACNKMKHAKSEGHFLSLVKRINKWQKLKTSRGKDSAK